VAFSGNVPNRNQLVHYTTVKDSLNGGAGWHTDTNGRVITKMRIRPDDAFSNARGRTPNPLCKACDEERTSTIMTLRHATSHLRNASIVFF
jgi:hypothetical protein